MELLERCDSLNIDVRNYMSVLSDSDEERLRGAFSSGRKVVEQVQAPGVVRRRRRVAPAEPSSRPGVLRVRRAAETTVRPTKVADRAAKTPTPVEKVATKPEQPVETPSRSRRLCGSG